MSEAQGAKMAESTAAGLGPTRHTTGFRLASYKPNWLLISFPTVIGLGTVLPARLTAVLLIGIGVMSFRRRRPRQGEGTSRIAPTWGSAILPALSLAIILRPNDPATVLGTATYVIGLIVFLHILRLSDSKSSALVSLIDGVGLFLVASVVLTLAGVATKSDRTAGLENSITGGKRVIFALSPHLAATPDVAGVFIAAIFPLLIAYRQFRFLRLTALTFAIYVLIASQVRMAIFVAVTVTIVAFAFPRATRAISAWLIALLLSLPFFFRNAQSDVMGQLGRAVAVNFPGMIRDGDAGGVLSTRQDIWQKAQAYQSTWVDPASQIFGYGAFGHVKSGAALSYTTELNFVGFAERRFITPHNSTLVVLYDAGWLGVFFFIGTITFAARLFARGHSPVDLAALSALIGLCMVGTTETGLTAESNQAVWWLLMGLVVVAFSREEQSASLREPTSRRRLASPISPVHPIFGHNKPARSLDPKPRDLSGAYLRTSADTPGESRLGVRYCGEAHTYTDGPI